MTEKIICARHKGFKNEYDFPKHLALVRRFLIFTSRTVMIRTPTFSGIQLRRYP